MSMRLRILIGILSPIMDNTFMNYSDVLKQLINQHPMIRGNQTELHRRTGVPQPTITRLVNGESESPRTSSLKPLAEFFNINLAQMRGEEDIDWATVFNRPPKTGPGPTKKGQESPPPAYENTLTLTQQHAISLIKQLSDKQAAAVTNMIASFLDVDFSENSSLHPNT